MHRQAPETVSSRVNGRTPPNWKLMLVMVCFPKKPLYAHHLPGLRMLGLGLHPPWSTPRSFA
jgi:hypothetical protein